MRSEGTHRQLAVLIVFEPLRDTQLQYCTVHNSNLQYLFYVYSY